MRWSETEQKILLGLTINNPTMFDALGRVDLARVYQEHGMVQTAILLEAVRSYRDQAGGNHMPTHPLQLKGAIDVVLQDYPELNEWRGILHAWADEICSLSTHHWSQQEREEASQKFVRNFVGDFWVKPRLQQLTHPDADFLSVREELASIEAQMMTIGGVQEAEKISPLLDADWYLNQPKTTPTDVPVLDAIMPIGLRHSQVTGILGPTGGGKSLLGVQTGIGQAGMGNYAIHATFEEPGSFTADPDDPSKGNFSPFTVRALGPAAGITREDLENSNYDISRLPAEKQRDYRAVQETIARNWDVIDFKTAPPAQATASALISRMRREFEARPFRLLTIDPFWPLVMNTAQNMGHSAGSPSELRGVAQDVVEQISCIAAELETHVILIHQLGASAAEGSAKSMTQYGAAEIRTFGWRLQNVIGISRTTPTGECRLILLKGRDQGKAGATVKARLDGDANMFTEITRTEDDRLEVKGDPEEYLQSGDGSAKAADFVMNDPEE